jgi:electron transfer flavoprotein alpha subunit
MGAIWAVAETRGANEEGARLKGISREVVACGQALAKALGKPLEAVVLTAGGREAAEAIADRELARVRLVADPRLDPYTPDTFVAAMKQAILAEKPDLVLFPHTYQVRDWVPRLAAALDRPLVSDVIGHKADGGRIVLTRQPYQGKLNADFTFRSEPPHLASLQAGAYPALTAAAGASPTEIVEQTVDLSGVTSRTEVLETFQAVADKVDLGRADIIVAVGRGIGKQEKIAVVEELASVLGAQLAASRPVCDNEWLPMDRQIGSSGQTVSPRLYVAVGISGAIQHVVGMKNAGTIVAINKDPNAPIFSIADYGIVGDLFEVVPALTAKVREVKGAA